jgi:hypothetical protein
MQRTRDLEALPSCAMVRDFKVFEPLEFLVKITQHIPRI